MSNTTTTTTATATNSDSDARPRLQSLDLYSIIDAEEGKAASKLQRDDSIAKKTTGKTPHIQPPGTLEYIVDKNDTIERIALKWNTVPSDIQHLNRLSSRMLYPGQVLYVPDPNYVPPSPPPVVTPPAAVVKTTTENTTTATATTTTTTKSAFDRLPYVRWRNNNTPKPGHIERSNTISTANTSKKEPISKLQQQQHLRHTLSEDEAKKLDEECMQRFLKLDSKLVSYEKSNAIDGVLLITPSALMFDPRSVNSATSESAARRSSTASPTASDFDSIIIPIEIISNVILYEDLSFRDVHTYLKKKKCDEEKSESEAVAEDVFDSGNTTTTTEVKAPTTTGTQDENQTTATKEQLTTTTTTDLTLEFAKTQIDDQVVAVASVEETNNLTRLNNNNNNTNLSHSLTNLTDSQTALVKTSSSTSLNNKEKQALIDDTSLSKTSSKHNSVEALRRHSINNIPDLFDHNSGGEKNNNLLLCYLCIKVNTHKDFISCPMDRKMKNRIQSEIWFQVPDNRFVHSHSFQG